MDEKPIGYLKFNKYVDKLVDNQIWMGKIESFTQRQPGIHNNDQILDRSEGKVNTDDGAIDYTELMNIVSPNLKTSCYIASFTGLYKSNFKNGKIKKNTAYNLSKLAGGRNFAVMESANSGTNSLEEAAKAESMSPRLRNPEMPLGYLDAKGEIKNYAQQVILYDEVAQRASGLISPTRRAKTSKTKHWTPKNAAFNILLETTREAASEHIKSLGKDYIAELVKKLIEESKIDVVEKLMRNMDTEYIRDLESHMNRETYNKMIKINIQRCNPLKPSHLNVCIEFNKVTYADAKIPATKAETIQRAKKDRTFLDKLLKMCFFEKPSKFKDQQEYRLVLIARETKAGQEFPRIMNIQYYKEPLSSDCNENMLNLQPIQAKSFCSRFIYCLPQAYLDDLGKSIIEERDNRVYPIVTKVRREYY
ncbi:hypothetical protein [Lacticaseibacillus paracasei]|uniref:Uncharacterized protein n=2 Tax=Lacticaseibacillus TaxID=2759736 RepID=A0A8B3GRT1_LACPA|nr:hypothetical protein [Lacticaseibacillus paracasei]RNE26381.1 hypothetical protein FAM6012_02850 [Lacticaseibacillus paracasei]